MCGIVCYFGGAGNNLTRILTGMSAIIYRAPDSTGVAVFGNDRESIVIRKAVGALPELLKRLTGDGIYPNQDEDYLHIWWPASDAPGSRTKLQHRLLAFEGFQSKEPEELLNAQESLPSFDDLVDMGKIPPVRIAPGQPGRVEPPTTHRINNRYDLETLITRLTVNHDLSQAVIRTLLKDALAGQYESDRLTSDHGPGAPLAEVLDSFDEIFDKVCHGSRHLVHDEWEERETRSRLQNPQARKLLWQLLVRISFQLPEDYDRDGVRCVFRLLDGALLARLAHHPYLYRELDSRLKTRLLQSARTPSLSWRELYRAEKACNVYGWAAAGALDYLRETQPHPVASAEGVTDPVLLRSLMTPIIAHGRWALQAAITDENAQPFADERNERVLALNGQFDPVVEERIRDFLINAGIRPRSENSAEYLAMLWGHYFDELKTEQERSQLIRREIDAGLDAFVLSSQTIDYRLVQVLQDKALEELDEMAFRYAVEKIVAEGGQIAVTAMSLVTPQRLYVAACNRPVFVVRRLNNNDIMVVSDINAALGLFPQILIQETRAELDELKREKQKALKQARNQGRGRSDQREISLRYEKDKTGLLERFRVSVTPFDKEALVGVIETKVRHNEIHRTIRITDFSGRPVPDLDSFETILNPEQVRKKALQTFYETHFHEIPDRLRQALDSHLPAGDADPLLPVRERHLYRRFGRRLETLRRVVIVGMGSSYHVGLMARAFFRRLLPGVHCTVVRPVEVEHVPWSFAAQGDLVILISVSGTSADMVELARILLRERVTMIALTEKPFADMALIAKKSAGVIPISAGEEVTYTAVKSTPCSLLAAQLLAVWLSRRLGRQDEAAKQVEELQRLPDRIERLIRDSGTRMAAETMAQMGNNSSASIVVDDLGGGAVGREIAMKLEENSWDAAAKWLDFTDIPTAVLEKANGAYFVLVHATEPVRFDDARDVMKALYLGRVPFAALTTDQAHREEIQFYCQGQAFFLPQTQSHCQPFMDLPFAYLLAAHYGIVHDRHEPGFPRNRAKSVTVSRSRPEKVRPPLDGVVFGKLPETASSATVATHLEGPSLWEQEAVSPWDRGRYRALRELAHELSLGDWLAALTRAPKEQAESGVLFHLAEACDEGQILFAAADRAALATARGLASLWHRLVDGVVEAAPLEAVTPVPAENNLLLVLSTDPEAAARAIDNWRGVDAPAVWLGPALEERQAQRFQQGAGYFPIKARWLPAAQETLYVLVNLFMIEVAKNKSPRQGLLLEATFRWVPRVIEAVLNDSALRRQIEQAAEDNRAYQSAAFYGSSRGDGLAWSVRFDQAGSLALQPYLYGEESYGPIVTVDPNVRTKFIELRAREEMVAEFGDDQVTRWEERFLGGLDIDVFLSRPEHLELAKGSRPCYVDGAWVLPVLSPRYDARQDNLIFIDATSPRNVSQAMDTLAVHGCRYARMILIKQKGIGENREDKGLFRYPISQTLELPSLQGDEGRENIPELLLPFAMNLVGTAMAASLAKAKGIEIVPVTTASLLKEAFGALGEALVENRIGVRALNQFIIEELQVLAPLVEDVAGVFRYRVEEVAEESRLRELIDSGLLGAAEQIMEAYEAHADDGCPFYLIHPDQDYLQDNILSPGATGRPALLQHRWEGAFGTSWHALYFKNLEMSDDPNWGPRVELPVFDVSAGTGYLYHLFVRYKPWDHHRSLGEESEQTARALGRGVIARRLAASRYGVIVGLFVEEPRSGDLAWNDRWLTLVPRHWLFSKPTREIASLLLQRTRALSKVLGRRDESSAREQLSRTLEAVWSDLGTLELLPDNERWQGMQTAVAESLKGQKD